MSDRNWNTSPAGLSHIVDKSDDQIIDSYTILRDVQYGDDREQNMDLYLAKEARLLPRNYTIIFLHGGGFYFSDKAKEEQFIRPYLKKGLNVVNLNYRLKRGVSIAVSDLPKALLFLKNKFTDEGFHLENLVLAGFSAGGQIASVIGYGAGHPDCSYQLPPGINITAIINIAGPVDKLDLVEDGFQRHTDEPMRQIGEAMFPESPGATPSRKLAEFEAINYFHPHAPAYFLWYGGRDDQIPSTTFAEFIGLLDPETDQVLYSAESGHVPDGDELSSIYSSIFRFLDRLSSRSQ